MTIGVIDYGVGNLASVLKAVAFAGGRPERMIEATALVRADAVVIPGVGHFGATQALDDRWRQAIAGAIGRGVPVLGICLGMQWLFDGSSEAPGVAGLGFIPGTCSALSGNVKVPHVGWNTLARSAKNSVLLAGIADGAFAYFTHSYAAPVTVDTVASTTHGREFASVVERGRTYGVQWHPEKSGDVGVAVLRNFVNDARTAC